MSKRTAVVTGGNRGIGYAVGEALARRGFRVVLVIRDPARVEPVRAALGAEVVVGDLSSRRTVVATAAAITATCRSIDVLVHNAGVWPTRLVHNEDGLEQSFAVNHLAPFQLNHALAPRLRRVVQVSAGLYVKGQVDPERTPTGADFHRMRTYCDTKLANLMLGGPLGVILRTVKLGWQPPAAGATPIAQLAQATTTGRYYDIDTGNPTVPTGHGHRSGPPPVAASRRPHRMRCRLSSAEARRPRGVCWTPRSRCTARRARTGSPCMRSRRRAASASAACITTSATSTA